MAKKKRTPRKRQNNYAKKAKHKGFVHHVKTKLDGKGNIKNTVVETFKDLVVGVVGGGLVGAAIGTPSLLIGIGMTGLGHYKNSNLAKIFGIGMMASNGFQLKKSMSGLDGIDGVKERLQAYKDSFSEKLYIGKLVSKKAAATNGIGDVQYFTYPNEMNGDLAALDYIENQITESGLQQMEGSGMRFDEQVEGIDTDDIIM